MGELVFPGNKSHASVRIGAFASLVNGDFVIIGSKKYEFRTSGSATPGNVQVNVGVDGPATALALQAAIVANQPAPLIDAYVDSVDTKVVRLEAHTQGTAGNVAFSASLTGATNIIDQTSGFMIGGEQAALKHFDADRYVITQLDVTATCIMIPTKLATPKIVSIQIFSALGAPKNTITTKWTVSTTRLKGALDAGTDPVAGDVVSWSARD